MAHENVDPALWALLDGFPPIDVTADTLPGFRSAIAAMSAMPDPASHPDVRIEEIHIPGARGTTTALRCLLFSPKDRAATSALLHVHSGGFVMGSPEMDARRNIELVRSVGSVILSVDYRLAPEHPHPAALEDCHAALVWLAGESARLRYPAERLAVIGESAGGGIAATLALLARDRRSAGLACQVLIYPMLVPPEHSLDAHRPDPRSGRQVWTRVSNAFAWSACRPSDDADAPPFAGLAVDLGGLPPAFVAVGDIDLFVHDDLAYASRLLSAGVPVEAHVYAGAIHGFDRAADAPVSRAFAQALIAFLRRHLDWSVTG